MSNRIDIFMCKVYYTSVMLKEKNILTPEGEPATGTSTDTVTIACTGKGPLQSYAGSVTTLGWLIARAVRQSLQESLDAA